MTHEVKLDVFEGPLDLLLHLIARRRVDIYDVPLADIARDYVATLGAMEHLDLESATGFLVVAAALLELKSSRLLPTLSEESDDEALLEARDELLGRLVECATYRSAGAWLWGRLEQGGAMHGRTAGLEPRFVDLAPDVLAAVSVQDLAAAAARLARPPEPELDVSHIIPATVSVRDAIRVVAARLQEEPAVGFRALCDDARGRLEVVVRFLALLELYKAGAVELEQAERFGDIRAAWTGEASAEEIAADAEEYAATSVIDGGRRP